MVNFTNYYKSDNFYTFSLKSDIENDVKEYNLKNSGIYDDFIAKFNEVVRENQLYSIIDTPVSEDCDTHTELTREGSRTVFRIDDYRGWFIKMNNSGHNDVDPENAISFKSLANEAGAAEARRFDNLQRIAMANHLQLCANKLEIPVKVAEKYILEVEIEDTEVIDFNKKYCVASKTIPEETENFFELDEVRFRTFTRYLAQLAAVSGWVDISPNNCRIEGEDLWIFDTEPLGLFIDKYEHEELEEESIRLANYCEIGLKNLEISFADLVSEEFFEIVKEEIEKVRKEYSLGKLNFPTIRWWLVILSILCPLVPLTLLVYSFAKNHFSSKPISTPSSHFSS